MKNEVKIRNFSNGMFDALRITVISDKVLFNLSDACKALEIANSRNIKGRLPKRGVHSIDTPIMNQYGAVVMVKMTYIDEANLYRCIFQSRKEKAEQFQYWVFEDVLPSIRKHGAYITSEALDTFLDDPDQGIRMLTAMKEEQQKQLMYARKCIETDDEVAIAYKKEILQNPASVTTRQIAHDYDVEEEDFKERLADLGILYKEKGQWNVYTEYKIKGYAQVNTTTYGCSRGTKTSRRILWTQLGRLFLYEKLRREGYLPSCEQ